MTTATAVTTLLSIAFDFFVLYWIGKTIVFGVVHFLNFRDKMRLLK